MKPARAIFKTLFPAIFLSISLVAGTVSAAPYSNQKVVYHINYGDERRVADTFVNMSNHIEELGEDKLEIKAVVHGRAIEYFIQAQQDESKQMTLDSLRLRGVQFLICGNTLTGYKVERDALYEVEEEDIVKAGLPALVDLQQKGFIYVRP